MHALALLVTLRVMKTQTPKPCDTELLTPAEVASELRVGRETVLRWLHMGRFPDAFKLSRNTFRIPRANVDALKRPA